MFVNVLPCVVSEIDARVQAMLVQMSRAGRLHIAFYLERKQAVFYSTDSKAARYGILSWELYFACKNYRLI